MSEAGKGTNVGSISYDVTADTAGLIQAQRETDKLTGKMEAALNAVADAVRELAATSKQMAEALKQNARSSTAAAGAADQLAEATGAASAATQGATRSATANTTATKKQADAAKDLADSQAKAADAAKKRSDAEGKASKASATAPASGGMSAAALAAAQRNIPAQVTDIVTGLSTGQSPLTVLMQQGGQLKDMFGGVGNAARALGGYVMGLLSPFTIVAGAIAVFVTGLVKGRAETEEFRKTLALTGDASGVTVDQLNALAKSMDDMQGVTRGQAAAALNEFVAAGIRGEDALAKFTAAAIRLEQIGGPSVEETAKTFQALARDPLNAALKLNEGVNFLTAGLVQQIKALEEQGRKADAAKVAQNAYADAINQRVPTVVENIGYLEKAWKGVANWAREGWDAILDIGRPDGAIETKVKDTISLFEKLKSLAGLAGAMPASMMPLATGAEPSEAAAKAARELAEQKAKQLAAAQAMAKWEQDGDKYLESRLRMEQEITQAKEIGKAAGLSDLDIQKRIAAIRKAYGVDARAAEAQAYYQTLVASSKTALDKINAEEQAALEDNRKRQLTDVANTATYQRARTEIVKKFARERALFEEQNTQEIADLTVAMTMDQEAKIEAIRVEAIRRADAAEKLGTMTHDQAARAKVAADFNAGQQRIAIAEKLSSILAETNIAATIDELTRIDLIRQENIRRADAAYKAGAISFAQAEADKVKASVDAQNAIRQQVLSINPLAQLQQEYEQKLAIVQYYEQQIAKAGVDATAFVEAKKTELAHQYQQQRLQIAESEFAAQSDANKLMMDSLNSLGQSASQSLTGLITGTISASEAMRNLAGVVLNQTVGALVQVGMQYIKNAILSQTADDAMAAAKSAKATAYTGAIAAQVEATTALAAQNAFMATAAIPIIGPELAPGAAAAAGAAAQALGAPAIGLAPIAGARRYGGPTAAGSLYRVNETGRPEMFTASNGSQYMLGGSAGRVTPADQVGIRNINVTIINPEGKPMGGTASGSREMNGDLALTVILSAVANDMASGGKVARATQSRFNLRV